MADAQGDSTSAPQQSGITRDEMRQFFEYPHEIEVHAAVNGNANVPMSVLRPDLQYVADARTVREATKRSYQTLHRWQRSGLFKNVGFNFEPVQRAEGEVPQGYVDRSLVSHFTVEEARVNRLEIGVSTTTSMVPEFNASVHNLLGRPFSASAVMYPAKSKVPSGEVRLRSQMPWVGREVEHSFGRRIENRLTSNRPVALADSEIITELKTTLAFGGYEEVPACTLTGSVSGRALSVKEAATMAPQLAAEYKPDTKVSLRLTAQRGWGVAFADNEADRNLLNVPVRGLFGGLALEAFAVTAQDGAASVASPLENVFVKGEATLGLHRRLCRFLSLDVHAMGGAVWSPNAYARVPLSDRFFLSDKYVRGYKTIGPNTQDFSEERGLPAPRIFRALGGNAVWAASTSLNFPLLSNGMLCGHLFANAGKVLEDWRSTTSESLFAAPSASIGLGAVATLPAFSTRTCGRLEANVSVPVSWTKDGGLSIVTDPNVNLFQRFRFGLKWSNVSMPN